MNYFIGALQFDDLAGDIIIPSPMFDVEARVGQEGVVVFATGTRGQPFTLRSKWFVPSYLAAQLVCINYAAQPSVVPRNIIRGTSNWSGTGTQFVVLSVKTSIQPLVAWQGLRGSLSPAFLVAADWQMQGVRV